MAAETAFCKPPGMVGVRVAGIDADCPVKVGKSFPMTAGLGFLESPEVAFVSSSGKQDHLAVMIPEGYFLPVFKRFPPDIFSGLLCFSRLLS